MPRSGRAAEQAQQADVVRGAGPDVDARAEHARCRQQAGVGFGSGKEQRDGVGGRACRPAGGPGESAGCHGLTSLAALLDRLASAAPGHRPRRVASGSPWVGVQCRDRARLSASGAN